jgi:hypothetical protein
VLRLSRRVSTRAMLSVTACRSRRWSAPSANMQLGRYASSGATGLSGPTLPSLKARQRRASLRKLPESCSSWRAAA